MARIPEEEIDQLKRNTSLADLVRRRGVKLETHGANLIGLCPYHDDREPSLIVTPSKNLWNCLGACGEGGDVIRWVMKSEGVSFRHAVELLRGGFTPAAAGEVVKMSTVRRLPSPIDAEADDAKTLQQVVRYYSETLRSSAPALEYLERRGIRSEEAIERFQLGYADRSLGLRLPAANRKAGEEIRSRLQALGVLRESGHEHLNGCLVVPVFDREGNVVEMYGRKINDNLRPGTAYHLYLPGPHRGVWNLESFAESKEIILCESLIDALTFWCSGLRNVTTSYGVNGFTEELFEALQSYAIERVMIAYDRDDAGDRAAEELAKRLGQSGIGCFRVNFPHGMDANEYALKVTPATQSLALLVRSAEWMSGPTKLTVAPAVFPLAAESPESLKTKQLKEKQDPDTVLQQTPVTSEIDPYDVAFGDRRYRVRGIEKNLSYEQLKVLLRVSSGDQFFLDTIDLVSARHRTGFIKSASIELGVKEETIKKDIARLHFQLEGLQEQLIKKTLEPQKKGVAIAADDESEALQLLRDPKLVERIVNDFHRCGVVGEETNKLMGYLAAVSRKLDEPLAIIVQSSSAAGKSALMEAVLAFMPEEERVQYSAMTGQSLFYMGETDLKHKILAISEEEGAERASYALKLLQSEGQLTIASTGKDPQSGKLVTHEYRVEGPVMIFLTTTAIEIDEELLNRCIVLTVDEDREQTRAIHRLQREARTLEGILARHDRDRILRLHRNAQRLLKPMLVANPFARHLTFLDGRTRTRRDHVKYLTLIQTIALLHQHQRERKSVVHRGERLEYIEVTVDDIALANKLAHEMLGRSLDELAPQTRRLLESIEGYVTRECAARQIDRGDLRFSQKSVREFTAWPDYQIKLHMRKLVEMEYLLVHRGGRGQSFVYELLYDGKGKDGALFLSNLIDVEQFRTYDSDRDSAIADRESSGTHQGQPGDTSGATSGNESNASTEAALRFPKPRKREKAHPEPLRKTPIVRTSTRRSGNGRAEA
jgi:DNA primase